MSVKAKSARGVLVDFDLLKVKQSLASAPATSTVKARGDFIDQKFKRRITKLTAKSTESIVEDGVSTTPESDESEKQ